MPFYILCMQNDGIIKYYTNNRDYFFHTDMRGLHSDVRMRMIPANDAGGLLQHVRQSLQNRIRKKIKRDK